MAAMVPKSLQTLVEDLSMLPGVGMRSAERYALHLLRRNPQDAQKLSESLRTVHEGVAYCKKTFVFTEPENPISAHYLDDSRDKKIVLVVEYPFDAVAIEKIGVFNGTYHVLGGLTGPLDGIGPEQLHIQELFERIEHDNVEEVILGTNANVEGETTALYIQKHLQEYPVKITRLAQGLPVGVDLEYADQLTLGRALEFRQNL